MPVCRRVLYTGQVQGVGFRYTAMQLAQGHAVTGFVRNLPDGRVELVAEGEPAEMDRYLEAVARKMGRYIGDTSVTDQPVQGYREFSIAR